MSNISNRSIALAGATGHGNWLAPLLVDTRALRQRRADRFGNLSESIGVPCTAAAI